MVKIISDSTCDLSKELLDKYDISILPLHILLGENEYEDGMDITIEEIYDWSEAHKETPKTSAPSIERTVELFEPYVKNGDEIVCFSISGTMSASGNIMRMAAEQLEAESSIHVIDSQNLSTGIGLLVVEAAAMAKEGRAADEIVDKMNELIPRVRASFVVDTLVYLHRGGRCSGLAAMAGGALKLHPRIQVVDGVMQSAKKYRGSMDKVILSYVKDMEEELKMADRTRVFITHSGCSREIVEQVRQYLKDLDVFSEIWETRAGGVVSSHCGPGTLGVLFIAS
ncbi:MAG: DegV family protein [Lachnospiraceae bacterium]|nr:DegV family protein [Lachnospiraceae bacterium]